MICDGRVLRMLDLDEFADACRSGTITVDPLVDGLHRWQRLLEVHLHSSRFLQLELTDFPPAAIQPLTRIECLLGPPVTWPE